jgi:hypothetical protein
MKEGRKDGGRDRDIEGMGTVKRHVFEIREIIKHIELALEDHRWMPLRSPVGFESSIQTKLFIGYSLMFD